MVIRERMLLFLHIFIGYIQKCGRFVRQNNAHIKVYLAFKSVYY